MSITGRVLHQRGAPFSDDRYSRIQGIAEHHAYSSLGVAVAKHNGLARWTACVLLSIPHIMSDGPTASAEPVVLASDTSRSEIVSPWWRVRRFTAVVGVLYAGYQLTNHWHWRSPTFLPLTPLDQAIPFAEWTVWPYLVLASCIGLVGLVRGRALFARATRALLLAYPINLAIFLLWPTTYPRVAVLPGTGLTHAAFSFLFAVDTPANCFPSGHITAPLIAFWAVARENPRWRFWIWAAFVLLCPTILTTKQHYVADLLGGVVVGVLGVWASGRVTNAARDRAPAIPRPRFNVGVVNAIGFYVDPLHFMARLTAECGTVAECRFAWLPRVFVNDPKLARLVLDLPHAHANKATRSVNAIRRISGESVLTANGETWARLRRLVQPAFHRQQVAGHVDTMVALARPMLEDWIDAAHRGRRVAVHREMRRLTFRFICKALFSTDPSGEIEALENWITTAVSVTWQSIRSPTDWALRLRTRRRQRFREAMAGIDGFVARLIAERRAGGAGGNDLLAMLLSARESDGISGLSDEEIRNECVTLMIAGYDTTSNALTWALLEIARHPSVAAELRRELAQVLAARAPRLDDLARLRWVRATFLEALRIYPPIWILERNLMQPAEVGGWRLLAGTQVLVSPWILHRLPGYWDLPERFDPQRFLGAPERGEENPAFLPFGTGPRTCIGRSLALLEGQVFLAAILQIGNVSVSTEELIKTEAGVSLRPRGDVVIEFTPRV